MGLANGKSVSHGEGKVLADLRRELDITDALHEQCLRQLGFTLTEFDNMSAPSDEVKWSRLRMSVWCAWTP
jgi:hypothetical protein